MDNQTFHRTSSTRSVGKNKALCEKTLCDLFDIKEKLGQPLSTFTEEKVSRLAEQLRFIISEMHNLPTEVLNEHIRSSELVFRNLQNTIIDLNLALDQLKFPQDKALFYRYLLSSQDNFSEIFLHFFLGATDAVDIQDSFTPIVSFPRRATASNYKLLLDFSRDVLPDLYTMFQGTDIIFPEQCEQAIADMKKLEEFLERQKMALNTSSTIFYKYEDFATLHCRLGVALSYTGELAQKLIHLFSVFQSRCHSCSKQTARFREEIAYHVTIFIRHYEIMLQKTREMDALRDQARFLHEHLESPLEDAISI